DGHKSLLDCFRSTHGATCEICVGEAVTAGQLADNGMPVEQIRETLRQRYARLFLVLILCGLGLPVPEDLALLAGGFMVYRGTTAYPWTLLVALVGVV